MPFVLVSTNHGTMIVNRNDYQMTGPDTGYGVAYQLLTTGSYDHPEIDTALMLLDRRRMNFGPGVVAIDCGANIGVHTVEWARLMATWGRVIAFEAQERLYYALAGNIAINNCLNASARNAAVGARTGSLDIPEPDYLIPSSFGSLELKQRDGNEFIGQKIDYSKTRSVPLVTIDSLRLDRLDFIKIDVEGMEADVLAGARESIRRHRPIMIVEIIKSDRESIAQTLERAGYRVFMLNMSFMAIHTGDPIMSSLKTEDGRLRPA